MANYLDGLVIIVREKFVCFCFRRIMMMIFCTGVRERENDLHADIALATLSSFRAGERSQGDMGGWSRSLWLSIH